MPGSDSEASVARRRAADQGSQLQKSYESPDTLSGKAPNMVEDHDGLDYLNKRPLQSQQHLLP